jgi:AcrR family transcriptional regulator
LSATASNQPPSERGEKPRRRRTQRERTEASAQRLLDAAIELIAEKGFDRTTVAEIGERAGYSRSMVRARYGSKEALLESIFGSELDRRLMPSSDSGLTGLPWVLARVDHVSSLLEGERELMRAFCVMSLEAGVGIASLRTWYTAWLAEYERQLAHHLRAGQRAGTVRAEIDADAEAGHFVLTGLGLIFRWTLSREEYDLAGELRRWRERLREAYAPPEGSPAWQAEAR